MEKKNNTPESLRVQLREFNSIDLNDQQFRIMNKSDYPLPTYATPDSSGMDLRANIPDMIILDSLERIVIPTGIYVALAKGTEAQVRSRSGMAAKHGIMVLNSPGTIDADYRGEIGVILCNVSNHPFEINPGDRIAQLVVTSYIKVNWREVDDLEETERKGGFGSTGKQ